MVGADADRLQLMMLAHRLSLYDNGSFGEILRHGDAHEDWRQKCGLYIRENQKTLTYGWLFGAGDKKRGKIVIMDWRDGFEQGLTDQPAPNLDFAADLGRMANERLVKGVDGLEFLVEDIHEAHKYGYFYSLDGRVIHFGARHAALCDILQNDEAVVMRHALVRCANVLDEAGWRQPGDYAMLLNVHDEWQMETEPWCADALGQTMSESIAWAGRELGVRVPLTGDYAVGKNWSQTH